MSVKQDYKKTMQYLIRVWNTQKIILNKEYYEKTTYYDRPWLIKDIMYKKTLRDKQCIQ